MNKKGKVWYIENNYNKQIEKTDFLYFTKLIAGLAKFWGKSLGVNLLLMTTNYMENFKVSCWGDGETNKENWKIGNVVLIWKTKTAVETVRG